MQGLSRSGGERVSPSPRLSGFGAVMRVLRKDLRESLRDRSLLLQLVVIPLFLYPLLGFAGWQVYLVSQGAAQKRPLVLMVDADTPGAVLERLQERADLTVVATPEQDDAADRPVSEERFRLQRDRDDTGAPDAMLSWWRPAGAAGDSAAVFYDRSRDRSGQARTRAVTALRAHRDSLVRARAEELGLRDADLNPWTVESENVAT